MEKKNKSSKVLTIILTVIIVGIIGTLGYIGYTILKERDTKQNYTDAANEFESSVLGGDNSRSTGGNGTLNAINTTSDSREKKYMEGYEIKGTIEIPKIDLETYVISEYSNQALGVSVTKFYGGNPNEVGNFCIAGHNYVTKNMFHNLKKLSIGDTFTLIDTKHRKGIYKIYLVETVEPDETQCLSQKTDGKIETTLITCTTDSSKRIIVKEVKI